MTCARMVLSVIQGDLGSYLAADFQKLDVAREHISAAPDPTRATKNQFVAIAGAELRKSLYSASIMKPHRLRR